MGKITIHGVKLFLLLGISIYSFSQTERFDIVRYTPPKNWKKELKPGIVLLTDFNESKSVFGVIAIYASTPSSGKPEKDFTTEWNDLAVDSYGAAPGPKTETQSTTDGWKIVAGAAPIVQDSIPSLLVLTVFSGFGKKISVLANFNDESYLNSLTTMLDIMKLDKNASAVKDKQVISKSTTTAPEMNVKDANNMNSAVESFGHMRFVPMKNWKVQKYSTAVIIKPMDLLPDHYLEMRIMESKPFSGSLQQAMTESWNEALKQLECIPAYNGVPYNILTEKTSYKGWEYIKAEGTLRKSQENPDKYDMKLFIVKLNDRIERILVVGLLNIQQGSYSPYVNPIYRHEIDHFFFNLKFDDWKEPTLQTGTFNGKGITGMYAGLSLKSGGYMGQYALFYSNGQVFFGSHFPSSGFNELNTWIAAQLDSRSWGTYSIQNGVGVIKMGYGNIPFKVNGNDLLVTTQNTAHKYERYSSVDGAVLNGTYGFTGDWGGKNPSVKFTPDGKFVDFGGLDVLNHQTDDPFNITAKPGEGTYHIKDYSMIFKYTDGRELRLLFLGGNGFSKNNSSPPSLILSANHDLIYKMK